MRLDMLMPHGSREWAVKSGTRSPWGYTRTTEPYPSERVGLSLCDGQACNRSGMSAYVTSAPHWTNIGLEATC